MTIYVFKNEEQLGPFEDADIVAALKSGEYSRDDLAWREGMAAWEPVHILFPMSLPPLPCPPQTRQAGVAGNVIQPASNPGVTKPISFGSGGKVEDFGFVRNGKVKINSSIVEISGPRHWHPAARCVLFVIGWLISTWLFATIFDGIGSALGGEIGSVIAVCGNPITAAVFTLWVVHTFCASAAVVTLDKSQIADVRRSGTTISLKAPAPKSGKLRRAVFRAHSAQAAQEIEQELS